jgi:FkbM family methyltransferase
VALPRRFRRPIEWADDPNFDLEAYSRAVVSPVYLGDHVALCRMLGWHKIFVDTRDTGFAANLLLDGYWELWLTRFIGRRVRQGMVAFDVGANYGYFTLLLGALVGPGGRVLACEPNPAAAAFLRRSVALNDHAGHTAVIERALGAVPDANAVLFVPNGEPKNAHLIPAAGGADPTLGAICEVSQTTLDQLAAELPRVDFIKVDAEGSEESILLGMQQTLARHKPCLILEFNPGRCRDARGLLGELRSIYGALQYLDHDGQVRDVPIDRLMAERGGNDWLLHFDGRQPC